MHKAFLLSLLLPVHISLFPESDVVKKIGTIVTLKNTECIIGLLLATRLCSYRDNKVSQAVGLMFFIASLGLYVSDYSSLQDAYKRIVK